MFFRRVEEPEEWHVPGKGRGGVGAKTLRWEIIVEYDLAEKEAHVRHL